MPCVVRLFASNDRATRLQLLTHLPSYVAKLSDDVLNGSVLTHVATGFTDATPLLREATVKACLHLSPRLTLSNLSGVVLKALRRALTDPEPAIRVNTTICIGRIAGYVRGSGDVNTALALKEREEGVLPCFLREMRDPFPPARVAALRAATYTVGLTEEGAERGALPDGSSPRAVAPTGAASSSSAAAACYWSSETLSRRLLPAAAYCATDASADARDAAFLLIEACTRELRAESVRRAADDAAAATAAAAAEAAAGDAVPGVGRYGSAGSGGAGSSGSGGAAAAATSSYLGSALGTVGWAVSSFTSKIMPTGAIGGAGTVAAAGAAAGASGDSHAGPAAAEIRDGGIDEEDDDEGDAKKSGGDLPVRHARVGMVAPRGASARPRDVTAAVAHGVAPSRLGSSATPGASLSRQRVQTTTVAQDTWGNDDGADDGDGWGDDDDDIGADAGDPAPPPRRAAPAATIAPAASTATRSGAPQRPRDDADVASHGAAAAPSSAGAKAAGALKLGGGGVAAAGALKLKQGSAPAAARGSGAVSAGDGWGDDDDDAPLTSVLASGVAARGAASGAAVAPVPTGVDSRGTAPRAPAATAPAPARAAAQQRPVAAAPAKPSGGKAADGWEDW